MDVLSEKNFCLYRNVLFSLGTLELILQLKQQEEPVCGYDWFMKWIFLADLFPPGKWDTSGELCPISVSGICLGIFAYICSEVFSSIPKEYNFGFLQRFTHSF